MIVFEESLRSALKTDGVAFLESRCFVLITDGIALMEPLRSALYILYIIFFNIRLLVAELS